MYLQNWLSTARIYLDKRLLSVLFLGFSSGLPLALTAGTLSVWLTEIGASKTAIGAFALVGLPYTFKFVWSPLIDTLSIPLLTRWLGRRRGWMILTQIFLLLAIVVLGQSNPSETPGFTAICAVVVAFFSASQDIVIDAFRVDILDEKSYGAGAATAVLGYRIGMLISGAGALYMASVLPWSTVYNFMALIVVVGMFAVLLSKEPTNKAPASQSNANKAVSPWLRQAVINPLANFATREHWWAILLFIMLYKLGDAFVAGMSNTFFIQIGFTKIEIANVTKVFGLVTTLAGGFIGGLMVSRYGILRALLACGVFQLVSNLMFALQANVGNDIGFLMGTIAIENIAGGMATAALVAYLSSLCNASYSATQFALLSSLTATGRIWLQSVAGLAADHMSWSLYFVFSTVIALPGMVLLIWLMRRQAQPGDLEAAELVSETTHDSSLENPCSNT